MNELLTSAWLAKRVLNSPGWFITFSLVGDRRKAIFKDDVDRRRFLETPGEACRRIGWRGRAFVPTGNVS